MAHITKDIGNGTFVTLTVKEFTELNWIVMGVVVGVPILLIWAIWIAASNLVNIATYNSYGADLYFSNILHLHSDKHIRLRKGAYLLPRRTSISDAEAGVGALGYAREGQNLLHKGHLNGEGSSWIAVEAYDHDKPIRGWLWVPCKVSSRDPTDCFAFYSVKDELADITREVIEDGLTKAGIAVLPTPTDAELDRMKESPSNPLASMYPVFSWRSGDRGRRIFIEKNRAEEFERIVAQAAGHAERRYLQFRVERPPTVQREQATNPVEPPSAAVAQATASTIPSVGQKPPSVSLEEAVAAIEAEIDYAYNDHMLPAIPEIESRYSVFKTEAGQLAALRLKTKIDEKSAAFARPDE